MESSQQIPLAVVGMSCRFPGGADSPEKLWTVLESGTDTWSEVPISRFEPEPFYHPHDRNPGTTNHRGGHFLQGDPAAFDAEFFGISPIEARSMDPQQRLNLETTVEALENAGIRLEAIKGSRTAVYSAIFSRDYDRMMYRDIQDIPTYLMTGSGDAILSNRISYLFDLRGPSVTIDTGCSGSMVALHQACQSLRTNESDMAIVNGANLILAPESMVAMSNLGLLNGDGKCYAFDSRGSGYGRGEGAATIIVKRLSDALAESDSIRCIIRDSGVNQDGKTRGILRPSSSAQASLIAGLYARNELDPNSVGYVEAHGTGTKAGDNAEIEAITDVFCSSRNSHNPLVVGSIKPNIGHLEAASGIAGIIKTILALEKGLIPATINLANVKPGLKFEDRGIKVPQNLTPWPPSQGSILASVNSYGYGGTNAHCILEKHHPKRSMSETESSADLQPASSEITSAVSKDRSSINHSQTPRHGSRLAVLSAHSEASLSQKIDHLVEYCRKNPDGAEAYDDLIYTLSCRRTLMQWRCSIVAGNWIDLRNIIENNPPSPTHSGDDISLTYVFTGQGAQWAEMGVELIHMYPVFERSLQQSESILRELGCRWNLIEEICREEASSNINSAEIAQPATTALQIALVDLLADFAVHPTAVVGHSSGEIAGAYAARILSHQECLVISYHRGLVAQTCRSTGGAMMAIGLGQEDASRYLKTHAELHSGQVAVACINSPFSTTLSGNMTAIDKLQKALEADGVFAQKLAVDVAYHSQHMQQVAADYRDALAHSIHCNRPHPDVVFFSTVTGQILDFEINADYWVRNLVSPVQFNSAVQSLQDFKKTPSTTVTSLRRQFLLEIGPNNTLERPSIQSLHQKEPGQHNAIYSSCLKKFKNGTNTLLTALGRLFAEGFKVDLKAVNSLHLAKLSRPLVNIDPYPWDHKTRFWQEPRTSRLHRQMKKPRREILGSFMPDFEIPTWRLIIGPNTLPWTHGHVVDNATIFPTAGYISMAVEAMFEMVNGLDQQKQISGFKIRKVDFLKTVIIPEAESTFELRVSLQNQQDSTVQDMTAWHTFTVTCGSGDSPWRRHCTGLIKAEFGSPDVTAHGSSGILSRLSSKSSNRHIVSGEQLYKELKANGNHYSGDFAIIDNVNFTKKDAEAKVTVPMDLASEAQAKFRFMHPAVLDAIFHPALLLFTKNCSSSSVMPVHIEEIELNLATQPNACSSYSALASISSTTSQSAFAAVSGHIDNNRHDTSSFINVKNIEFRGISPIQTTGANDAVETFQLEWGRDVDCLNETAFVRPQRSSSVFLKEWLLQAASSIFIRKVRATLNSNAFNVIDNYRHLHDWLKHAQISDETTADTKVNSGYTDEDIICQCSKVDVEGEALSKIGSQLHNVLSGAIDPLSLFLNDGLLYRLYSDESTILCSRYLSKFLNHLKFKRPGLRILEVGAGTGGTTTVLLNSLASSHDLGVAVYDFTDISPGFFAAAKETFREFLHILRFRTLDISQDPEQQGFELGSYDLIIASNVLHATSRLDTTLFNVRQLLKPVGKLALIEITRFLPYMNLTYGILPGWWNGVNDGRVGCPFLSQQQWQVALKRNGFSGLDLALNDYNDDLDKNSFMISHPLSDQSEKISAAKIHVLCGCIESQGCSASLECLITGLRGHGANIQTTEWSSLVVDKEATYIIFDSVPTALLQERDPGRFEKITLLLSQASCILWLVCSETVTKESNTEFGLVTGMARVARTEHEALRLFTIKILAENIQADSHTMRIILKNIQEHEQHAPTEEYEYHCMNDQVFIPRVMPDHFLNMTVASPHWQPNLIKQQFHQQSRPFKLHCRVPGLLDSMEFIQDEDAKLPLAADEVLIDSQVHGVNLKDVSIALGQVKSSKSMSGECAGTVSAVGLDAGTKFRVGDKVCAWNGTSYSSKIRVKATNVHRVPPWMKLSEAASIPVAFLTAWYGLVEIARLQKGDTVLVHAAAGDIGQAAVILSQFMGARVFATIESNAQRSFLMEKYNLPGEQVFFSTSASLKADLLALTNNNGVDIVLNSSLRDEVKESWNCIAAMGTFIDVGKPDVYKRSRLDMQPFDRNATFASVDLSTLADKRPEKLQIMLQDIFHLLEANSLKSITPLTSHAMSEIATAFRSTQSPEHIGKVILESDVDTLVMTRVGLPSKLGLPENATFVVAGAAGFVGRQICYLLAKHGISHILALDRSFINGEDDPNFSQLLDESSTEICNVQCDITNSEQLAKVATHYQKQMPPVAGVIQASAVYEDVLIKDMTVVDFATANDPQVTGTVNLENAFNNSTLGIVLTLSSISGIIGGRSQGNVSSGNTLFANLAHESHSGTPRHVSVCLGALDNSEVSSQNFITAEGGLVVPIDQAFSLLVYILSDSAQEYNQKQCIFGLDKDSIAASFGGESRLRSALFNHLPVKDPQTSTVQDFEKADTDLQSVEDSIKNCKSAEEAEAIFVTHITRQIATLTALNIEQITPDTTIDSIGVDSLIAVELRNWISRKLRADAQVLEIQGASSVRALSRTIFQRSGLSCPDVGGSKKPEVETKDQTNGQIADGHEDLDEELPKQPLTDLHDCFRLWITAIEAVLTREELHAISPKIEDFLSPGGLGEVLQSRLRQRAEDPSIVNWQSDLHVAHNYLKTRAPSTFQTFFMSLLAPTHPMTQIRMASLITSSALQFKSRIEFGQVPQEQLNGQPVSSASLHSIFNTNRMPSLVQDLTRVHANSNHVVAIRNGHFFKIVVDEGPENEMRHGLEDAFKKIMDTSMSSIEGVATLTTDNRDSWAKLRGELIAISQNNADVLEAIEGSAFMVFLDDENPCTSSDRYNQFLKGNPKNRWGDKTLSFIVCPNGASSIFGDHSAIDGVMLMGLVKHLNDKFTQPESVQNGVHETKEVDVEHLAFDITPRISENIQRITVDFSTRTSPHELLKFTHSDYGSKFMRMHQCAPHAGFQVIIQLASLMFFEHLPACWETVSLRTFRAGRIDLMQTVLEPVREFCYAMLNNDSPNQGNNRRKFREAVVAITAMMAKVSAGKGYSRHLAALQEVVQEDEEMPALFTDPGFAKIQPAKMRTDRLPYEGVLMENGVIMPDPDGIWLHYEVGDNKCFFAVTALEGRGERFFEALRKSLRAVHRLLEPTIA